MAVCTRKLIYVILVTFTSWEQKHLAKQDPNLKDKRAECQQNKIWEPYRSPQAESGDR